jgi:type IV pilus assembly protein PilW
MKYTMTRIGCRGLTLVELMIALALSLLVIGAAASIFLGSKQSFRLEEDISMLQENYRFIADRFNKDFSAVGYTGCSLPFRDNSPTIDDLTKGTGYSGFIQGFEGGAAPDSITVTYAEPESGIPIVEGGADDKSPLYVSKELPLYKALIDNFSSGSTVPVTLLVGNCKRANIFLVTSAADATTPSGVAVGSIAHVASVPIGGVKNTSDALSDTYGRLGEQTASVYERTSVTYEIDTVNGVTGLYETRSGSTKQLVLDNVTDMQILYGIDSNLSDGNADTYQAWDNKNGLNVYDITSLKVTLTMIVTQQNGVDVTRDYTFTTKLRNLGLDI